MTAQKNLTKKTNTSKTSQSLQEFVERLVVEKNFPPDTNKEVLEQVKKDVYDKLNAYLNARLVAALSDKDLKEFNLLLDKKASQEDLEFFVQKKINNFQSFLTEVLLSFRKTYLGLT